MRRVSEEEVVEPRLAEGTHHNEIAVSIFCLLKNLGSDRVLGLTRMDDIGLHAVPAEHLSDFVSLEYVRNGMTPLRSDGQHERLVGVGEERKRIARRDGGLSRCIPGQQNAGANRLVSMIRRDKQHRSTAIHNEIVLRTDLMRALALWIRARGDDEIGAESRPYQLIAGVLRMR